jgi:hypothetical protein
MGEFALQKQTKLFLGGKVKLFTSAFRAARRIPKLVP